MQKIIRFYFHFTILALLYEMRKKKIITLVLLVCITFISSVILIHLYSRTDDLSLRYNLWKMRVYPYQPDHIPFSVLADQNRHVLIKGKSINEIKKIFPNAHENSITEQQKQYVSELSKDNREYLWIGDTNIIIFLKEGVGDYINIMKG